MHLCVYIVSMVCQANEPNELEIGSMLVGTLKPVVNTRVSATHWAVTPETGRGTNANSSLRSCESNSGPSGPLLHLPWYKTASNAESKDADPKGPVYLSCQERTQQLDYD